MSWALRQIPSCALRRGLGLLSPVRHRLVAVGTCSACRWVRSLEDLALGHDAGWHRLRALLQAHVRGGVAAAHLVDLRLAASVGGVLPAHGAARGIVCALAAIAGAAHL